MTVLIIFLCGTFLLAGSKRVGPWLQRPLVALVVAVVVAASFYSLRIVQ